MKEKIHKLLHEIIQKELASVLESVSEKQTKKFVDLVAKTKRIFLTGSGRSGFVANSFAMRLVQLGLRVYVIGESTTPSTGKGDLLVVISGSGKTKLTEDIVLEARKAGTKICLITANKKSGISKKSELVVEIKAKTKTGRLGKGKGKVKKSIEPLGTLFEQSAFIYLDGVIL